MMYLAFSFAYIMLFINTPYSRSNSVATKFTPSRFAIGSMIHVGDALMWKLIDDFAVSAKEAEERGEAPTPPKVPERVREIWRKAEKQVIPDKPAEPVQKPAAPMQPVAPARAADPMEQGRLL